MGDVVTRVGGFIALGVILFWIWHDANGTIGIISAVGAGSQTLIRSTEGNPI